MIDILAKGPDIKPMTAENINTVKEIEDYMRGYPQENLPISHVLHAGLYARSVTVPAGVIITSVLVKIPTLIIVNGNCGIWFGGQFVRMDGYRVFTAAAQRKQIFIAKTATNITMCFPTQAKTVKEAEEQFTDEAHLLQNREG